MLEKFFRRLVVLKSTFSLLTSPWPFQVAFKRAWSCLVEQLPVLLRGRRRGEVRGAVLAPLSLSPSATAPGSASGRRSEGEVTLSVQ